MGSHLGADVPALAPDASPATQAVMQNDTAPSPSPRSLSDLILGPEASQWSRLLVHDHLNSSDRLALLGTCTAARDMMLVTAPHLDLHVDVRDQQASLPGLLTATKALVARGQLPTKLQLRAGSKDQHRLSSALTALQPYTTWLQRLHLTTLDDALLGLVLQYAPALEEVAVDYLELKTAEHAHTQTKWRRLQVPFISLSSLAHLPLAPGGFESSRYTSKYTSAYFDLTTSEEAGAVAARVRDVRFSSGGDKDNTHNRLTIIPGGGDGSKEPTALRLGLSLMRPWSWGGKRPIVTLRDWTMSGELMQELPGLPHWDELWFKASNDWLPKPQLYKPLLSLLPDSYRKVVFTGDCLEELSVEQVWGICSEAPRHRSPEAPLSIRLCHFAERIVQQFKEVEGSFPNVVVVSGYESYDYYD